MIYYFTAHTINCVCHSRLPVLKVLEIYIFGLSKYLKETVGIFLHMYKDVINENFLKLSIYMIHSKTKKVGVVNFKNKQNVSRRM